MPRKAPLVGICSYEGCGRPLVTVAFCGTHSARRRTGGDMSAPFHLGGVVPIRERLLAFGKPGAECWNWEGTIRSNGYSQIKHKGKCWLGHRLAYELLVGPIPAEMHLDHLCRNTRCVNPKHLEPVTCRTNLLRGNTFQAANAAKTHCLHGHPFTGRNLLTIHDEAGRPERQCRTCNRERMRRRRARHAALATDDIPNG